MEASTFANVAAYAPPDVQLIEAVRSLLVRSTVLSSMFLFSGHSLRGGANRNSVGENAVHCRGK